MVMVIIFSGGLVLATAKSILSVPSVAGASTIQSPQFDQPEIKLKWPKYGQSAIGAQGYGVLETSSDKDAQPTASVAKVMTVLAVLDKHPLNPGEQGPEIPITQADQDLFGEYFAKNGTSVNVEAGTTITLHEALQYILIPSANNIADTTAIWAFGSMEEYTNYANELGKSIGMENSNFADGSGFSPKTVSTASDLVKLGEKAMQNPVIAEIVRTWEIELPDGSKAQNSNVFLDFNGNRVIGIKTGDTDQAGGVYLFAAEHDVDGETITIIGAVMGAKTLTEAEMDSMKLLASAKPGFSNQKVVSKDQVVGTYSVPWQGDIDVAATEDIYAVVWSSQQLQVAAKLDNIVGALALGQDVGEIVINLGASTITGPVALSGEIAPPTAAWKLKRYL